MTGGRELGEPVDHRVVVHRSDVANSRACGNVRRAVDKNASSDLRKRGPLHNPQHHLLFPFESF